MTSISKWTWAMTLLDRKKLIMVVSVVSFRGVLLSRNCIFLSTVSVIHHCFTALTDYFQPFPAGSLFSPPLYLFARTVFQQTGVKCPVRAITLIEQNPDPGLTPVLGSHQANTTISKLLTQSLWCSLKRTESCSVPFALLDYFIMRLGNEVITS